MKRFGFWAALALVACTALLMIPDAHAAAGTIAHAVAQPFDWHLGAAAALGAFATKNAGGGGGDPEADIKALSTDLKKALDEVKGFAEQADKQIKATGKITDELKAQSDQALIKHNEISARLTEVEQKLARRGGEGQEVKTVGQEFVENDDVKAYMEKKARGSVRVGVKAITSAANSAGVLVEPQRVQGIVAPPNRRLTVRDLLTPGRTGSNAIEYVRETGFTNAAAPVAETTQKPESSIAFELITTGVKTIAHWVPASKQILDDAAMLMSYIDGRLRYGLEFVEELEILKGDGTGQHLLGIIPQAEAYSAPFALPGETMIDRLRLAQLQAALAEYAATGHVLNPVDWTRIELTKDGEGRYIIGNPQTGGTPTLWRLPVVETQAIDEDKFLTGAFKLGAQIFDRESAAVEVSTEDRDNFIKNMVTVRAEERLALAVYRPEAFVYGDFGNVP